MAKYKVAANSIYIQGNSAGTAINLSSYIDSITPLGKEITPLDVTAFTDAAERIIAGIERSQEYTISGFFDDAATTGPDAILSTLVGVTATFTWAPVGTASGARKISGTNMLVRYIVKAEVKGRVEYEAHFKVDGTVAIGTY